MKIDKDFIIYMCFVLIGALCISLLMYCIEQNQHLTPNNPTIHRIYLAH
jgi:hypothetical protein